MDMKDFYWVTKNTILDNTHCSGTIKCSGQQLIDKLEIAYYNNLKKIKEGNNEKTKEE